MDLIERDLQHVWHPCSQMKDYETFPPLAVASASDCYITLQDGSQLIDALSSWWCKSLGHGHPRLRAALIEQSAKFEHVLLANTTNEVVVDLSCQLATLIPALRKVMYASDGSCAVEIALKMSIHAQQLRGQPQRTQLIALENGYHGETALTLSVSDLGLYRTAYTPILTPTTTLRQIPYVTSSSDPLWHDCAEQWPAIEQQLAPYADTACAIIVEPLLQGAGGMRVYSADLLRRLAAWARQHQVYLIADEIMTGIGRTGYATACELAGIEPDFLCLGKGLTAGWLPLSAVVTRDDIYQLFYDDYATYKAFMHSHTHSGNALACRVAVEVFKIIEEEAIYSQAQQLGQTLLRNMQDVAQQTGLLHNIRQIGALVAADLTLPPEQQEQRVGYAVYQRAIELGALLRPLGNTLYWLPPLTMNQATANQLRDITIQAIKDTVCYTHHT